MPANSPIRRSTTSPTWRYARHGNVLDADQRVVVRTAPVSYLRPLAADGRQAVASGRVMHSGRRVPVVASAEVLDGDRKPVAVATSSALFLPGRAASLLGPSG